MFQVALYLISTRQEPHAIKSLFISYKILAVHCYDLWWKKEGVAVLLASAMKRFTRINRLG